METLSAYIPADRRQALARGGSLPERSEGAALFADISGFTALTEALVVALGAQRGAEELGRQLMLIYDALITEVDQFGGSVISFSGDAITCWFDDPTAAARATTCALAMQGAMEQFASVALRGAGSVALAIKVAVAAGPVRRLVVGDPAIQRIDALVGETLVRLAAAEASSAKGEVVIDEVAAALLGEALTVAEWRDGDGGRFAVVGALSPRAAPQPWPEIDPAALDDGLLRPWLLPPVYDHLVSGQGEFLTELRPAVALFLRFAGIDYDADEQAHSKLDQFIRQVQSIVAAYEGFLVQLTIGDKGSYLYAVFGAPLAHENDAVRAAAAALELQQIQLGFPTTVQIGISQGRMRTGAYGGVTRRTYGVLGDEVNIAARLMQRAGGGEVLVALAARKASGDLFVWESLAPLQVKGKAQPLTVFRLVAARERPSMGLHEQQYATPLVGRAGEVALLAQKLDAALAGRGQVVAIVAEAGMGKSRLVAEGVALAQRRQVATYAGECQSYGSNTSYLVWQGIWRDFFGLKAGQQLEEQHTLLERQLAHIDGGLLPRLPLLRPLLNLAISDNELTASFDAKLRKESLEALLTDTLRAGARERPLLLVLEDCHWIDPLSHDLLETIGRAIATLPVLLLLAYRPPQVQRLAGPRVSKLPHFTQITLDTLPPPAIEALVGNKLAQLYGPQVVVPADLVAQIGARTQGNPFYIEELLNDMHDREIDPQQPAVLLRADLPTSLHSLILSRIDRLTDHQRTLIKIASVIGRLFQAAMLWGISPFFAARERVLRELEVLNELELTAQDAPEPELVYLFKHVITQEVTYESLPFATRAVLHEQIGHYIEQSAPDASERHVDLLAFHYERSQNEGKRRAYLLLAGDGARATYANAAAIDYYRRLLPLLDEEERAQVLLKLGQVLELTGQWAEAHSSYAEALALAERLDDRQTLAQTEALIGGLLRKQGQYAEALPWLERARAACEQVGDERGLAQVLHFLGLLAMHQGQYAVAQESYTASLALRRAQNDLPMVASLLSNLSITAYHQGDAAGAWALCNEALALRREVGNKLWIANSLGNMGMLALEAERYAEAQGFMQEALAIERDVGDRSAIAISLNNLGNVARALGDSEQAYALYRESLAITNDLGDMWAICYLLEDIGCLVAQHGQATPALQLVGAAARLREEINAPLSPPEQERLDERIAAAHHALGALAAAAREQGRALGVEGAIRLALEQTIDG